MHFRVLSIWHRKFVEKLFVRSHGCLSFEAKDSSVCCPEVLTSSFRSFGDLRQGLRVFGMTGHHKITGHVALYPGYLYVNNGGADVSVINE